MFGAETKVMSSKYNDKQWYVSECIKDSDYCRTCLESEINPMLLIREFYEKSFITSSGKSSTTSSFNFQNRSFKDDLHHSSLSDHQIIGFMFIDDGTFHIFRTENKVSGCGLKQFDYLLYLIRLIRNEKQKLALQFSKGRLLYSKCGIFGINSSFMFQSDPKVLKPHYYSSGDQVKSSKLNIEHPPEFAGQWSPSSSEDG
jgi:hypothetical protein